MKNLFEYATKELSQDAFLRWLFENYEDFKEDQIVIKRLLGLFSNEDYSDKELTIIDTYAQYKSVIDVAIRYRVAGKEHLLVMENKTQSYIHSDQLDRYYKLIESEDKSCKKHYCYFKANRLDYNLSKKDHEDLDYLNKHKEWNKVTLKDIYEVVKEHKSSNFLFYQWIDHITMLYEMYYELKHYKSWDIRAYQIFLNTELKENFKEENGWIWYGDNFFSQGNCLYFWATRKSDEEDYIELQMQYRLKEKDIWADLVILHTKGISKY